MKYKLRQVSDKTKFYCFIDLIFSQMNMKTYIQTKRRNCFSKIEQELKDCDNEEYYRAIRAIYQQLQSHYLFLKQERKKIKT